MVARFLRHYGENHTIMTNEIYAKTEYLIRRWWLSLIVGLVAIVFGFVILIYPAASYYTFGVWLGLVILLSGIMGLMQSTSSRNYFVRRGWLIVAAVVDIIIGVILIFNILLSEMMLPILLGCWLLYRACTTMAIGLDLKHYSSGSGWMIFYSLLIFILSIAILWMPMSLGVTVVVLFVALGLIFYGISMLSLSMRLWEVHRHAMNIGADE